MMPNPAINERLVFSHTVFPPIGEPKTENIIIEASEIAHKAVLAQKIAAVLAQNLGYDDPSALEDRIQLSHKGIILGQADCNTIQDLRGLQSHESAGKRRESPIIIKILP